MAATSATLSVPTTAYAVRNPGTETAAASSEEFRKSRRFMDDLTLDGDCAPGI